MTVSTGVCDACGAVDSIGCECPGRLDAFADTIARAELALGQLSPGEQSDLLLDNHPEIRDHHESRRIVRELSE